VSALRRLATGGMASLLGLARAGAAERQAAERRAELDAARSAGGSDGERGSPEGGLGDGRGREWDGVRTSRVGDSVTNTEPTPPLRRFGSGRGSGRGKSSRQPSRRISRRGNGSHRRTTSKEDAGEGETEGETAGRSRHGLAAIMSGAVGPADDDGGDMHPPRRTTLDGGGGSPSRPSPDRPLLDALEPPNLSTPHSAAATPAGAGGGRATALPPDSLTPTSSRARAQSLIVDVSGMGGTPPTRFGGLGGRRSQRLE